MRKAVIALALALMGVLLGASPAWAEGEAVRGTLRHDGEPVANVTIRVFTEDGQPVGEAVSAEDGTWTVEVPGPGTYRVDLDESTLPDGLVVRNRRPSLTPRVNLGNSSNVIFPLGTQYDTPAPGEEPGQGGSGGSSGGATFNQPVFLTYSGIHFGLIIALAALGLSLIFGTTGLTNFAHGELVTIGAVVAYFFNAAIGLPLIWAALVAVIVGGLFGYLQDLGFWSWLRRRGTGLIAAMIISIGVALILRFLILYLLGGDTRRYTEYVIQTPLQIGPLTVTPKSLITDAVAIVVLVAVSLALVFTRLGKATRAVADNPSLAAASGVAVNSIVRLVWAIGGGLAALAGVILGVEQGVQYQMGQEILLLIFSAVVLGGLGTAWGALLGSLIIGLFIQLSTLWIPGELKFVGALVILVAILLVRPQGLLGRAERVG